MDKDINAIKVERAIYNWYQSGQDNPGPILNAMKDAIDDEMQVYVPIQTPEVFLQSMGNPEDLKVGDTFSLSEDAKISFCHIDVENDEYYIPIFTSEDEYSKEQCTGYACRCYRKCCKPNIVGRRRRGRRNT